MSSMNSEVVAGIDGHKRCWRLWSRDPGRTRRSTSQVRRRSMAVKGADGLAVGTRRNTSGHGVNRTSGGGVVSQSESEFTDLRQ